MQGHTLRGEWFQHGGRRSVQQVTTATPMNDTTHAYPDGKIPVLSAAVVRASSEAAGHPVGRVFDGTSGPGASQWIAGEAGDQTIIIAFHHPHVIGHVTMEVEEREVARTQEVQLAFSSDGGVTYRELVRQEFNFSPEGTTWEREDWAVGQFNVTHLRLAIKPDKGRKDLFAKLTSLAILEVI